MKFAARFTVVAIEAEANLEPSPCEVTVTSCDVGPSGVPRGMFTVTVITTLAFGARLEIVLVFTVGVIELVVEATTLNESTAAPVFWTVKAY